MTTYTIIAYRCNGTDSVMGCVQDRVDSDFDLEVFYGEDALTRAASHHAAFECALPYSKYMTHEWEVYVLFDGMEAEGFRYDWQNDYAEIPEHVKIITAYEEEVAACKEIIKTSRQKAADAAKKKAASVAKRRATLAKKKKEADERAQLKRLQEKYHG